LSNAPIEALLDSLTVGAAWLDGGHVFQHCNRVLEGWLGRQRAEILGRTVSEILGDDTAREVAPRLDQALAGETASHQIHVTDRTGDRRALMLRYRPYRDDDGAVVGVFVAAELLRDEGEEARSRRRHELEEVQRIARLGTYHTDLKRGTWTASEEFCRIFGFEPGGVYTREEFQEIVHPADLDAMMAHFDECVTHRWPFDMEYRCIARDTGEVIDVRSISQIFFDDTGAPDRIIGIKQDITEQKVLERKFLAAQRLEAVGSLAGGVAHDFNNLLTAISGFAELAEFEADEGSGQAGHLAQVIDAADRARNLTSQLLAFSRRQIVQPETINLNAAVHGLDHLLRRLIGEHIDLHTQLATNLWNTRVDPGAVEQVLVNLAVNARDAMPAGGALTMETRNKVFDEPVEPGTDRALPAGEYVVLAVSDSGTGIDEEDLPHIFEPFYTTKPEGQGTGLGLATCYGLVAQASGQIAVHSEGGRGTTFRIFLPRVDDTIDETEDEPSLAGPLGTERILVVEDDDAVRDYTVTVLRQLGYDVLQANDGIDALDVLRAQRDPVDLLLTDVVMPQMSGRELASTVREHFPTVKVLYMSGYTGDATVHRGELDQGSTLLEKPFTQDVLGAAVRRLIDH